MNVPISGRVNTSSNASDRQTDVGRVLLVAPCGREDEIDRGFGEGDDVLRVAAPVGVGALHGNLPPDHLRLEQALQLGLEVRPNRHRHVVEVDHQRGIGRVGGGSLCAGRGK